MELYQLMELRQLNIAVVIPAMDNHYNHYKWLIP